MDEGEQGQFTMVENNLPLQLFSTRGYSPTKSGTGSWWARQLGAPDDREIQLRDVPRALTFSASVDFLLLLEKKAFQPSIFSCYVSFLECFQSLDMKRQILFF